MTELATAVALVADTLLPTRHGVFRMAAYDDDTGITHVALVMGAVSGGRPPLVRVHSECLTGDAFGSYRCDCGEQLDAALAAVAAAGRGVVLYVRGHEGRGIGLRAKLRAYALQDEGADTVDANRALGLPDDSRSYDAAAAVLADLGVTRLRLLTSNPAKVEALTDLGIDVVERVRLPVDDRPENARYLATKRARLRHDEPSALDRHLHRAVGSGRPTMWNALVSRDPAAVRAAAGRIGLVPSVVGPDGADDAALLERYGPLLRTGPLVLAQLGQSLDGFIASRTGDSCFVTGEEDRTHLHRLRALVDAVVIGGATAAVDDPQLTVRAVPGPHPVRVVVDPRGALPPTARMLTDGVARTIWIVGARCAPAVDGLPAGVEVVPLDGGADGRMDPAGVLALLRDRGLERVLVEGGGRLVSAFVAAGLVDTLYLTIAPLLVGDGVPGLRFAGRDALADARRGASRRWWLGEDVCNEIELRPDGTADSGPLSD